MVTKVPELLDDMNWSIWKNQMELILHLCGVAKYVEGKAQCPSDTDQATSWDYNDDYTKVLISNNISSSQVIHVKKCTTSCAMWDSLKAIHESKGHETTITAKPFSHCC